MSCQSLSSTFKLCDRHCLRLNNQIQNLANRNSIYLPSQSICSPSEEAKHLPSPIKWILMAINQTCNLLLRVNNQFRHRHLIKLWPERFEWAIAPGGLWDTSPQFKTHTHIHKPRIHFLTSWMKMWYLELYVGLTTIRAKSNGILQNLSRSL